MARMGSERVRPSPTVLVGRLALLAAFLLVLPLAFAPRAEASSPSISADGRYVAFSSTADNLSAEDNDPAADIFVRDLQTGTATLVSRASGPTGAAGDRDSEAPAISADGRFVAFASLAANLSTEDRFPVDIFVRDLQTNTTTLVSRASGASGPAGDRRSEAPSISADGRFVAFASSALNFSAEDNDPGSDVFVRDLQANTTTLVSRASGVSGEAADFASLDPSISADGRSVAFDSEAANLGPDIALWDVFVRDLQANTTTLVSRASGASGAPGDDYSITPSISADGRYVAFDSEADNLSAEDNDIADIFVRDLQANTTTLVSRASGAAGAAADSGGRDPSRPAISADGRYVAFDSLADNLSTEDYDVFGTDCYYFHGWLCYPAPVGDIFVRDLQASTTTFASRASGAAGEPLQSTSIEPSISADGRYVAFSTCRRAEGSDRVEISVRDLLSESTTLVGEEPVSEFGCGPMAVPTADTPDTTPPKTKITKRAPNRTHKQKVKFKFKSSEPNSTFECKRDQKRFKPCGSPTKLKRLKRDKHKFKVRAIDAAGNTDPTPAKDKFKVLKPKRRR
jgi:Tol biopolymer transport system component